MKTTIDYLNEYKDLLGLHSDNQIAISLGVTRQTVSQWRAKTRIMNEVTCEKIAIACNLHIVEVQLAAMAERTKKPHQKEMWQETWKIYAKALSIIGLLSIMTMAPQEVKAANAKEGLPSLYIMLSLIWATARRYFDVKSITYAY